MNYLMHDNRLVKDRKEKIQFAIDNGYKHYGEMLHKKHDSGMTAESISKWINSKSKDFKTHKSTVAVMLQSMKVFKYIKYRDGFVGKKSTTKTANIKKKNLVPKTKKCSCCEINKIAPGNRMLCHRCFRDRSATQRHGLVNFTG